MRWRREPIGTLGKGQNPHWPFAALLTNAGLWGRRQTVARQKPHCPVGLAALQVSHLKGEAPRPQSSSSLRGTWSQEGTGRKSKERRQSARCKQPSERPNRKPVVRGNPARSPQARCGSSCHRSRRPKRRLDEGASLGVATQGERWGRKTECLTSQRLGWVSQNSHSAGWFDGARP